MWFLIIKILSKIERTLWTVELRQVLQSQIWSLHCKDRIVCHIFTPKMAGGK